MKPRFQFSQVVVVDDDQIGVICKSWGPSASRGYHYEVYVRSYNSIVEYDEDDINHYVFNKELAEDERELY